MLYFKNCRSKYFEQYSPDNHKIYMKNLFLLTAILFSTKIYGQAAWKTAGILYSDSYITVELEYKLQDICNSTKISRFRYMITGQGRGTDYYVNWRMNYIDCNAMITCQTNSFNIGNPTGSGTIENMDWSFPGKELEKAFYNVQGSNNRDLSKSYILGAAKLEVPKKIRGKSHINYGESTTLSAEDGLLMNGARWAWYTDQCGKNLCSTGTKISVRPLQNTTYYLRGESPTDTTGCVLIQVTVNSNSDPADKILLKRASCTGNKDVELSVSGGRLGESAKWVWYADDCGKHKVGTGTSIKLPAEKNKFYYVRAEGKTNTTACKSISVNLNDVSIAPTGIKGERSVCEKQQVTLEVIGGVLAFDQEWVWYKNTVSPGNAVGTGLQVTVSPTTPSTTYIVMGEGPCGTTASQSVKIMVSSAPVMPSFITQSSKTVYQGKKIRLGLYGGTAGSNTQWAWYKNSCGSGNKIGTGNYVDVRVRKKRTFYMRPEGDCDNSNCLSTTVIPDSRFLFVNIGLVGNGSTNYERLSKNIFNDSSNLMVTIGQVKRSGWYIRGKFNLRPNKSAAYNCDNTSLLDNPGATMLKFNGLSIDNRLSGTFGLIESLIVGSKNLFYYIGAGYGKRNLYWGVDEFNTPGTTKTGTAWAKNITRSTEGLELEGGVLLRLAFINIIGGGSIIYKLENEKISIGHSDFHISIGLSF
jgi:Ig-like domain CHU_C associated